MTKELPPSRTAEQFVVRFPDGMRDKIAESAKANNRSMNAEIVARLERSFSYDQQEQDHHVALGAERLKSAERLEILRVDRLLYQDLLNRLAPQPGQEQATLEVRRRLDMIEDQMTTHRNIVERRTKQLNELDTGALAPAGKLRKPSK